MGLNKGGVIVVVLLIIIGFLFVFDGDITGEVILEDIVDVNNCSDYNIGVLWDSVFVVDGVGNVSLKNYIGGEMNCNEYIIYKNNSDGELWAIYEHFYDNSWVGGAPLYKSGKSVLNEVVLEAFYLKVSVSFLNNFVSLGDVDDIRVVLNGVNEDEVVNRSVLVVDGAGAADEFASLFDFDVSGLTFVSQDVSFLASDSLSSAWSDYGADFVVVKNETFLFVQNYVLTNYDPSFVVDFTINISDYEFDMNSSWNAAFNVSDYFNLSEEIGVFVSSYGTNNTEGEWIDVSIVGGEVSFKPAVNFTGSREFVLAAINPAGGVDAVSNAFNVSIVIPNDAPVLRRNFEAIAVPREGGARIALTVYFEDPDGDDLSYRVTGDDNLNVTISGGVMTIRLGENFNDTTRFKVYASDGIEETGSNNVYVYEEGDSAAAELVEELIQNETDNSTINLINETTDGGSGASVGSDGEDDEGINWILWGSIIIGVLILVLVVIWFFVLRNGNISDPDVPVVAAQNPVNSYLANLNLGKK